MTLAARLPKLPEGFVLEQGARGVIACRPGERQALVDAGFLPDRRHFGRAGAELEDARESGREPLGQLAVGGRKCLARRFSHGGLARALTGRRFRDPARPFVELAVSERLRGLGIATPRVVAARAVSAPPFWYELTLVTERIASTVDVGHLLGAARRGEVGRAPLRAALRAAGGLIRALHEAGFLHADLQPANVLVPSSAAPLEGTEVERAWIIDLDRSRFVEGGPLDWRLRAKNLGRLWRHVRRRDQEYGAVLAKTDILRFLEAYGVPRGSLRERMRAIEAAADEGGGLHRVGWWLERTFGRKHDARAGGHDGQSGSATRG